MTRAGVAGSPQWPAGRVDLASIGWKSRLDRLPRSRMATRPFQFTGMGERHTPKSELLPSFLLT